MRISTLAQGAKRHPETATVTNNIAPFVQLMHEAETVGIVRSVRFFAKNTIGQFFWEVSEICDGCHARTGAAILL